MADQTIPARLLCAYRDTAYVTGGITVRIGRRSAAMDDLLRHLGGRSGVFITAWNPLSRRRPTGCNQRMQRRLHDRLPGRATLPADGTLRHWHEAHWFVAAPPRPLLRLARMFRQRALVVVRRGQPAQLVVLCYRHVLPLQSQVVMMWH